MQLNDVLNSAADQERGAWLDLLDPVTWQPTGIKLRIAGPDSATARRARLKMADDLAELAGPDGRVTAEHRETCRKTALASLVLAWEVEEGGKPVPFSTAIVLRLLSVLWVEEQVDAFAADRSKHLEA